MYTIDDFIPHRDRMRLVQEIVEIDNDHCVTRAVASPLWPLYGGGHIGSLIIVELVAQTVSVYVGWRKREKTRLGGKGVIVGIKDAVFPVPLIPAGAELKTSCRTLLNLDNTYGEFEGEVKDDRTSYGCVRIQTLGQ